MRQIFGIILIVIGVAYFTFHGFTYTSQEKVLDIGPIEASANTEKQLVPYSPLLGGVIIVGGLALFIVGFKGSNS